MKSVTKGQVCDVWDPGCHNLHFWSRHLSTAVPKWKEMFNPGANVIPIYIYIYTYKKTLRWTISFYLYSCFFFPKSLSAQLREEIHVIYISVKNRNAVCRNCWVCLRLRVGIWVGQLCPYNCTKAHNSVHGECWLTLENVVLHYVTLPTFYNPLPPCHSAPLNRCVNAEETRDTQLLRPKV